MSEKIISEGPEIFIKRTTSKCVTCSVKVPGEVLEITHRGRQKVILRRECKDHGRSDYIIGEKPFYWPAIGDRNKKKLCNPGSGCCSPKEGEIYLGTNATDESRRGDVEKLSTCTALIDIVSSCNMACPTCFTNAPAGSGVDNTQYRPVEDLRKDIQAVLDRKGPIEILQFSGGEPTLHPQFFELVEWVRTNHGIQALLINTNGVRFANDLEFVRKAAEVYRKHKFIRLYLQFDGPQEAGQKELRGGDFRAIREKAVENCGKIGLPVHLAMTVNHLNLPHLWDTIQWAESREIVFGVSFQPEFLSGRNPVGQLPLPPHPITVADILNNLSSQADKRIDLKDFTPLPCGDPNCTVIGWLARLGKKFHSPTKYGVDVAALQSTLPDRMRFDAEDLKECGCDNSPLGELIKKYAGDKNLFQIVIKPFMDARMWDQDRVDRCCTHVIAPGGTLHSFCEYYGAQLHKKFSKP